MRRLVQLLLVLLVVGLFAADSPGCVLIYDSFSEDIAIWTFRGPGGMYGIGRLSSSTMIYLGPSFVIVPLSPEKLGAACGVGLLALSALAAATYAGKKHAKKLA